MNSGDELDELRRFRVRAIALVILLLTVTTTHGQTVSELERKYGKPVSAYNVSEHIWMTADFSSDGQVCQMRLYPKRIGPKTDNHRSQLVFPELTEVLNEIVPPHLRGLKKDGFGQTSLGGGTAWTIYAYENVSFNFISSYKLDPDIIEKAKSHVLKDPDPDVIPLPKKTAPSLDDFAGSKDLPTEIVTVRWNRRPCTVK
jgi:hypothetical protein